MQGLPLADVEVVVTGIGGPDPSHPGLSVQAKGRSSADGRFDLRASLGPHRLLIRAQVGATVYLPALGPEFEVKAPNVAMAGFDMSLVPTTAASLSVTITPLHGVQQEDVLTLEQILALDGVEFTLPAATLKPTVAGDRETASFANQPPGTYALSLWRSETTGTHAMSGSAKASITLLEGGAAELSLMVK